MIGLDSSHLEPQFIEPPCRPFALIMTRRYYVPDLPTNGGLVTLPSSEAQHATRVMRVQAGDTIELFDGKGRQTMAVIVDAGRKACHCDAQPSEFVSREPQRVIHLGIGLPKPDRAREMIERLTELGVKTVTPLMTERTQRAPSDSLIEKLRRGVIEACKQSGRNETLDILETQKSNDFFASDHNGRRLIAHPSDIQFSLEEVENDQIVTAAIGPEGGWTENEHQTAMENGFQSIDLGKRIYRIETAATVIASLLTTDGR